MTSDISPQFHPDPDLSGEWSKGYYIGFAELTLNEIFRSPDESGSLRRTERDGLSMTGYRYWPYATFRRIAVVLCHRSI